MEQFNSETQQRLFDADHADDFMSGFSRAFTLAGPSIQNVVERHRYSNKEVAVAEFMNAASGETFTVTVKRGAA